MWLKLYHSLTTLHSFLSVWHLFIHSLNKYLLGARHFGDTGDLVESKTHKSYIVIVGDKKTRK